MNRVLKITTFSVFGNIVLKLDRIWSKWMNLNPFGSCRKIRSNQIKSNWTEFNWFINLDKFCSIWTKFHWVKLGWIGSIWFRLDQIKLIWIKFASNFVQMIKFNPFRSNCINLDQIQLIWVKFFRVVLVFLSKDLQKEKEKTSQLACMLSILASGLWNDELPQCTDSLRPGHKNHTNEIRANQGPGTH